jgi:hypothetical protein
MISIAATVCPLVRMSLAEMLWQLPAAIAYQFFYLHWQRAGSALIVDDRAEIKAALCRRHQSK